MLRDEEGWEVVREQQPPTPNDRPAVWPMVIADMQQRDSDGIAKYGTPLQPFNGRKPLVDLYQELLDAVVYCRQEMEERDAARKEWDGWKSAFNNREEEFRRVVSDRLKLQGELAAFRKVVQVIADPPK